MDANAERNTELKMTGLSDDQQAICLKARQDFLGEHELSAWGVTINLAPGGSPELWKLEIITCAPKEFNSSVRQHSIEVGRSFDIASVVRRYLQVDYRSRPATRS